MVQQAIHIQTLGIDSEHYSVSVLHHTLPRPQHGKDKCLLSMLSTTLMTATYTSSTKLLCKRLRHFIDTVVNTFPIIETVLHYTHSMQLQDLAIFLASCLYDRNDFPNKLFVCCEMSLHRQMWCVFARKADDNTFDMYVLAMPFNLQAICTCHIKRHMFDDVLSIIAKQLNH